MARRTHRLTDISWDFEKQSGLGILKLSQFIRQTRAIERLAPQCHNLQRLGQVQVVTIVDWV